MKNFMLATTAVLALTGAAMAETHTGDLSQLQQMAEKTLTSAGVEYDVRDLSTAQLAEIKSISEEDRVLDSSELYAIIGMDEQPDMADPIGDSVAVVDLGPDQMKTQAQQTLSEAGIAYNVDGLSTAQLTQIKEIQEEDNADKHSALYSVLGLNDLEKIPMSADNASGMASGERDQLETIAYDALLSANVPYDVNKLSNAQLTEIKAAAERDDAGLDETLRTIIGTNS